MIDKKKKWELTQIIRQIEKNSELFECNTQEHSLAVKTFSQKAKTLLTKTNARLAHIKHAESWSFRKETLYRPHKRYKKQTANAKKPAPFNLVLKRTLTGIGIKKKR